MCERERKRVGESESERERERCVLGQPMGGQGPAFFFFVCVAQNCGLISD